MGHCGVEFVLDQCIKKDLMNGAKTLGVSPIHKVLRNISLVIYCVCIVLEF